jgi:hypothetical protein
MTLRASPQSPEPPPPSPFSVSLLDSVSDSLMVSVADTVPDSAPQRLMVTVSASLRDSRPGSLPFAVRGRQCPLPHPRFWR